MSEIIGRWFLCQEEMDQALLVPAILEEEWAAQQMRVLKDIVYARNVEQK